MLQVESAAELVGTLGSAEAGEEEDAAVSEQDGGHRAGARDDKALEVDREVGGGGDPGGDETVACLNHCNFVVGKQAFLRPLHSLLALVLQNRQDDDYECFATTDEVTQPECSLPAVQGGHYGGPRRQSDAKVRSCC